MAYSQHTADRIQKEMEEHLEGFFQTDAFKETKVTEDDARVFVSAYTAAMYEQEDRTPKRWTRSATETIMTTVLPEKIKADKASQIIPVLEGLFTYLEKNSYIKNGETLIKALHDFADEMFAKFGTAPAEKAAPKTAEATPKQTADTPAVTETQSATDDERPLGWDRPKYVAPEVQKLRRKMAVKQFNNKVNKKLGKKKRKK